MSLCISVTVTFLSDSPIHSEGHFSFVTRGTREGLGVTMLWPNAFARAYPSPVLPVAG